MSTTKNEIAEEEIKGLQIMNPTTLSDLMELDTPLVVDIFQSFVDTQEEMINAMTQAATSKIAKEIEFHAHSIRGVAGNLGGERVAYIANIIESRAAEGNSDGATESSLLLQREVTALSDHIQSVISELTAKKNTAEGNPESRKSNITPTPPPIEASQKQPKSVIDSGCGGEKTDPAQNQLKQSQSDETPGPSSSFIHAGLVLCIDDAPSYSAQMRLLANKAGYKAIEINDPSDTGNFLDKDIALVLLDYSMKPVSGLEVLKQIRSNKSIDLVPVIMATSKTEDRYIVECLEAGANDYLTKPLNLKIASARINTHLTSFRLQREQLKHQETSTIRSMVVTYNHEINNPLAVAISCTDMIKRGKKVEEKIEKLETALARIRGITKDIQNLLDIDNVSKEHYAGSETMYSLAKADDDPS